MSEPEDADGAAMLFRRRSILGPPSLFPSQKTSEAGTGTGILPPNEASCSSSRPLTQDTISEEISLTIADLDFYYGLGNALRRL